MADDTSGTDDCEDGDLELLRSGNFADVEIVCGDRSWKCHRAILVPRSVWFRKALSGPFQEASNKRISLDEETPVCVELALKFIYGRGLNVESSVSEDHFVEHCVLLWHIADFLLLDSLKSAVHQAVFKYCDKKMKHLRTWKSEKKWRHDEDKYRLSPWALDIVLGIQHAYKWDVKDLKAMLMEFIWVGRGWTLGNRRLVSALRNHLKDTPAIMDDLLSQYASGPWIKTAVWAPDRSGSSGKLDKCGLRLHEGDNATNQYLLEDKFPGCVMGNCADIIRL
ncbi:hypothetical protein F5883DRAFT_521940 [Diaporthe sp. PMI_573]|nr:hypothetical protein F5883DRAFT_521940 [Diaporthaceae sp. PMI_573]